MSTQQRPPTKRNQSPAESAPPPKPAWYALPAEKVFSQLEATPGGLSSEEARRRLAQYGYNELTAKKRSAFVRFMLQFHNSMIYILLAAETIPAYWAAVVYILLRAVDSYLHKSGIVEKGLTRF